VHQGYANAFGKLWPDVQALLKAQVVDATDKKTAPASITFSGHSLGGNLAQLLGFAVRGAALGTQRGMTRPAGTGPGGGV
jgi:acetyl esterase/lipase